MLTNAGYASYSAEDSYANRLLVTAGIGLHLVTYYDKIITLEYTLNKSGPTGSFIGTGLPL